jgi:hypothetical protein
MEPAFPETVVSTFRLDGSIVKGPATAAQPSFKVRTNAAVVEVMRMAGSKAA